MAFHCHCFLTFEGAGLAARGATEPTSIPMSFVPSSIKGAKNQQRIDLYAKKST
jgi:hypothetical protein